MRTTIYITKQLGIFLLFLAFNIYVIVQGVEARQEYRERTEISKLRAESIESMEAGDYVYGSFDSFVGNSESGLFNGTPEVIVGMAADYHLYTIPTGNGQFVRVWIGDLDRLDVLEEYDRGYGEEISFEGELLKLPVDDHYLDWCSGVEREDFTAEKVIPEYVIREVSFEKKKEILDAGVVLLVVTVVQLISLNGVISIEPIPQTGKKMPYKVYQLKDALESEEKRLQILERRLYQLKKDCFWQIPVLLIGVFIIISIPFIEIAWIGIALILYAGLQMITYYLNAGSPGAERLMRLFDKASLARQIQESEELIDQMRIRMEDFS